MPAALYKLMRAEDLKDPNPVQFVDGRATTSSLQVQMPFLCHDCEQRLGDNGERWVISQCWRPSGFKLREAMLSATPLHAKDGIAVYDLRGVAGSAVDDLIYFAASVFWRSSAGPWPTASTGLDTISLGSEYQEQFRLYLLGEAGVPTKTAWALQVAAEDKPLRAFNFPATDRTYGYFKHRFYIPGLTFTVFVGKTRPANMLEGSLNKGRAFIGPLKVDSIYAGLLGMMGKAKLSKNLKKRYK